jgi:hypothetical protein
MAVAPMTGDGAAEEAETARLDVDESAVLGLRTLIPDGPPSRRVEGKALDGSRRRLLAMAPQSSALLLLLLLGRVVLGG